MSTGLPILRNNSHSHTPIADDIEPHHKPTIAIIETRDYIRATCLRVAQALARPESANLFICHWHGLEFSIDKVVLRAAAYQVQSDGSVDACTVQASQPVNALFFYGPDSGELEERDAAALDRLSAAGIDIDGAPIHVVVDRMMIAASRRGVATNALGSSHSWGPKHNQELKLRRYEHATHRVIARPETYIARPHELRAVLSIFAGCGETCLIKPAFGEGGRGFSIVRPGQVLPTVDSTVVVQRLIPDPLLVDGHKADIRFYLFINVDDKHSSGRLRPVFLRRAAVPYVAESRPAEITNTSYRLRHGLAPDMRPLAITPGISRDLYDEITSQLDSLAYALVDAYFWNAIHDSANGTGQMIPNRLILFGVDVLVASSTGKPRLYFLETNPFPGLFRGAPDCDEAVDEMLSREYLPALLRAGHSCSV